MPYPESCITLKTSLWNTCLAVVCVTFFTHSFRADRGHAAQGASLDLGQAVVVTSKGPSIREQKAVSLLVDEVEKRTRIRWRVAQDWPEDSVPVVAVGLFESISEWGGPLADEATELAPGEKAEGFRIRAMEGVRSGPTVVVAGRDERGVLFGVGCLLRELTLSSEVLAIDAPLDIQCAPKFSLRGHQLGYRPKTNSYDAWTVPMWEQYIRDLAVFGTNAVELIPPRSDDDDESPHFPLPKMEMMIQMSQLLDDYGLDVWIWYPAMDSDYSNPKTVESALVEWGAVLEKLPRVDAILVPAGDPGHTQPKHLMPLLEKQTEVLQRHHPEAEMWVSAQSFNEEWLQEFLGILQNEKPSWLTGVVFGPQVRIGLPALRKAVPTPYQIRRYPDITHTYHCQYPVPDWDAAYNVTLNREPINPRPTDYANIFRLWDEEAVGFIAYSEGCNDDVNKIVWSCLGWDPEMDIFEILREYSKYFIGERYVDSFAQGLLALERNWRGPLLTNDSVYTTLEQFRSLERSATPGDLLNWRFQQGLYRAYYDAYTRRRLIYETELENLAMEELRGAERMGSSLAVSRAEDILDRAVTQGCGHEWRARVFELAEALYQSIRMQLSVPRYKAISVDRGANLDLIDTPLNSRNWLKIRFEELRRLESEEDRLRGIDEIVNWTDPGPGGFYEDLGDLSSISRVVSGPGYKTDPEYRESALIECEYTPERRLSWVRHASSRYDFPLKMQYNDLDPEAEYKVRVVYAGDNFRTKVRLLADDRMEIHPYIEKPRPLAPLEFDVPKEASQDGALTLSWYAEMGRGGNGRGCQVAEVWVLKR